MTIISRFQPPLLSTLVVFAMGGRVSKYWCAVTPGECKDEEHQHRVYRLGIISSRPTQCRHTLPEPSSCGFCQKRRRYLSPPKVPSRIERIQKDDMRMTPRLQTCEACTSRQSWINLTSSLDPCDCGASCEETRKSRVLVTCFHDIPMRVASPHLLLILR